MCVNFDHHNRKDVTLKGSIKKQGYIPGQTMIETLEMENPRRVLLKKLHLSLIQQVQIESTPHQEIIIETNLPIFNSKNDERLMENFSLTIPSLPLAPSYLYCGDSGHTTTIMEFDKKCFCLNFISYTFLVGD